MLLSMSHSHSLECFFDPRPPLDRSHAPIDQWQLDILEDGKVANQVETLEDESNRAIANASAADNIVAMPPGLST